MKKFTLRNLCLIAGCALIAVSLIVLIGWYASASIYEKQCKAYVQSLEKLIPPVQSAYPEQRLDNNMPSLAVDGNDFVALLEFPVFDSTLPVCNEWGNTDKYPRRFTGSVYNNTMMIGCTDRTGQLDYVKLLSVGDTLFLTDMTGNRYTYRICDIEISPDVELETLRDTDAVLTVFVKNTLSFDYTIIRCESKS